MKKKYIAPTVESFAVANNTILDGSPAPTNLDSSRGTRENSITSADSKEYYMIGFDIFED